MSYLNSQSAASNPGPEIIPMPDVIDALKRLERIGSESSKTTLKLVESARQLADQLVKLCALKANASVEVYRGSGEGKSYIPRYRISSNGISIHDGKPILVWTREDALQFSEHIANGLLDLIVAELEEHEKQDAAAIPALEETSNAVASILKA